jgi:hypothetical protein
MDQDLFCFVYGVCPVSGGCNINLDNSGLLLVQNVCQTWNGCLLDVARTMTLSIMILWFKLYMSWMGAIKVFSSSLSRVVWNHSKMIAYLSTCFNG